MTLGTAKVTAQGQISVPAAVRKRLGLDQGSILEFEEVGGQIVMKRKGVHSFAEIHRMLFPDGPPATVSLEEMDRAVRRAVVDRYKRSVRPAKRKRASG